MDGSPAPARGTGNFVTPYFRDQSPGVGHTRTTATGRFPSQGRPACQIHKDENGDIFVLIGGMKIAKRGLPHTAHANTWIMLEPGWCLRDVQGGKAIEVSYEHTRIH
jgi:hypothetical protein